MSVSDGVHTTTVNRQFTYDEYYETVPTADVQLANRLVRNGLQSADTFLVRILDRSALRTRSFHSARRTSRVVRSRQR